MEERYLKGLKTKGLCRVHWLLWCLPSEFKGKYILKYDYAKHEYCFYRLDGRKLYDIFIVIRTSRKCFRCSYLNAERMDFQYFSCRTSAEMGLKMFEIYKGDNQK